MLENIHYILDRMKFTTFKDWLSIFKFLIAYPVALVFKRKHRKLWLICDTGDQARDNGYWLYKYIRENHPEQEIVYAIYKNSIDYDKVSRLGKVVEYGSLAHWIYYLAAEQNLSSDKGGKPNAAVCYFLEVYGFLKNSRIFLQHGITTNESKWLYYNATKMRLFVCGALPEYYFVKNTFGYPDNYVNYLGFARFDSLHKCSVVSNRIVIMPTWREWLSNVVNDYDGLDEVGMPFIETDYFKKWNSFINNQKLKEIAEKYSLEIIFFPHRNMQKFIENFQTDNQRVKFAKKNEWDIQELLKSCAMLITDYSSVFWDVVYMKKPVVFYQFDTEKFRRYQYGKGWFDYENNTFGKCCTTEGSCIEEIIKEKLCNFTVSEDFLNEHKKIFPMYDNCNSRRIYEQVKGITNTGDLYD